MEGLQATNLKEYLVKVKDDYRYKVEPSVWSPEAKFVQVNLNKLRLRLEHWLMRSFIVWDQLSKILVGRYDTYDSDEWFDPLQEGCQALAITMVQQVYVLLAHKARRRLGHAHPRVNSITMIVITC